MNTSKISIVYTLLISIVLLGCKHDPNSIEYGEVEIALEWKHSTPAKELHCLFYDESGKLVGDVKADQNTIKTTLPEGKYHFIIYNSDAKGVNYRGIDNHDTAELYVDIAKGNDQILQPDAVYLVSSCQNMCELTVSADEKASEALEPRAITKQIKLNINTSNIPNAESLYGKMSGVAPSVFASSGHSNFATTVSTTFNGVKHEDDFEITINALDFVALSRSTQGKNVIDATIIADGKPLPFSLDLTSELENSSSHETTNGDIPIKLQIDITIKEAKISATVKPWNNNGEGNGNPTERFNSKHENS